MRVEPIQSVVPDVSTEYSPDNNCLTNAEARLLGDREKPPIAAPAESGNETRAESERLQTSVEWTEDRKRQIYRVSNRNTDEVVCQIPSEQVLQVAEEVDRRAREQQHKGLDVRS